MRPATLPALLLPALALALPASAATLQAPGTFGSIQGAIDASSPGDVIDIQGGDHDEALIVPHDLTLLGDAFVRTQLHLTPVTSTGVEGAVHVLPGVAVTVQSLDVRAGATRGIYAEAGSTITLTDVALRDSAGVSGGAAWVEGTLVASELVVENTSATTHGGGLWVRGDLTCTDCALSGTTAGDQGGAVWHDAGDLTLVDTTIAVSRAARGGAVFAEGASTAFTRVLACDAALNAFAFELWSDTGSILASGISGRFGGGGAFIGVPSGGSWTLDHVTVRGPSNGVLLFDGRIEQYIFQETGHTGVGDTSVPAGSITVTNSLFSGSLAGADLFANGTDALTLGLSADYNAFDASVATSLLVAPRGEHSLVDMVDFGFREDNDLLSLSRCTIDAFLPVFWAATVDAGLGTDLDGSPADIGATGGPDTWPELHADADADGFSYAQECDDTSDAAFPGGVEVCDGLDNDCDGETDTDADYIPYWYPDADEDGYGDGSAPAGSGIQNCGSPGLEFAAYLGTVWAPNGTDCNDADPNVNPGMPEDCAAIDRNCDSSPDFGAADATSWWPDLDDDGHGDATLPPLLSCSSPGPTWVANIGDDCDDATAAIHPGITETCNGIDENCTGNEDDATDMGLWYPDADGDTFPDAALEVAACTAPKGFGPARADGEVDCDDTEALAFPGNPEVCDGIDNDCSLIADDLSAEPPTWYADDDGDGYGSTDPRAAITSDCPASGYVATGTDCDDTDEAIHPDASEPCDGIDNDCSGTPDDGPVGTWYVDNDGDGWGSTEVQASCRPDGVVEQGGDCQDAFADIHPGAEEVPGNDIDEDCVDGPADPASTPSGEPAAAGCQCSSSSSSGTAPLWLGALTLALLRRRSALAALGLVACAPEPADDRIPEVQTRFPTLEEASAAAPWFAIDEASGPALIQRDSRATFRTAEPGVVELHHRGGTAPLTATLALVGLGRSELAPVPAAGPPEALGARVVLERGALVEWYLNGADGIEQGFTLRERPQGAGPLRMALAVDGLAPRLQGSSDAIAFLDEEGQARFRYDHLVVTDRDDALVPAHLATDCDTPAERCHVELVIDDADAAYPLYVDPLLAEFVSAINPVDAVDNLGAAVALDGDRAVIGSPAGTQGRVFILERNVGNPDAWGIEHTIVDGTDGFGASVALDYPYLVVGAPESDAIKVFVDDGGWSTVPIALPHTLPGTDYGRSVAMQLPFVLVGAPGDGAGTAWLLGLSGSVLNGFPTPLTAGGSPGDRLGSEVALALPLLLAGAPGTNGGDGAVHVFDGNAILTQTLAGAAGSGEAFGSSLALSTARMAVGAPNGERVALFDRDADAATPFVPSTTPSIAAPPQAASGFGSAVALENDTLVAGDAGVGTAAAHHFAFRDEAWFHAQTTVASTSNDGTPLELAMTSRTILAGAPGGGTRGEGALWNRTDDVVLQTATLEPDGNVNAGRAVAIEGDLAAVGDESSSTTYGGRVTLFRRSADTWALEDALTSSLGLNGTGEFGASVAIDGGLVLVGAPGYDHAFLYTRSGGGWTSQLIVDPEVGDGRFGFAVDIDGLLVAVGDPSGRGRAQLYTVDGDLVVSASLATIDSDPDGTATSPVIQLGSSVAVNGNRIAIGAPGWDGTSGANTGKVEVWDVGVPVGIPVLVQTIEGLVAEDRCGNAVDLDADLLAIACSNDPGSTDPGKSRLYRGDSASYTLEKEVVGPDQDAKFATSVAIDDDRWLVGAKGLSRVRMYQRNTNGEDQWGEEFVFDGPNGSNFGSALAIDGNQVIIGAPNDGTTNGGSARIYELDATIPPTLYDDTFFINEDDVDVPLTVVANDISASLTPLDDSDAITTNGPTDATLVKQGTELLFTPDPDYYGTQTFEYTVPGALTYASVTVTVLPVNDLPLAVDDAYATVEETLLSAPSVLANDSDVESPLLTASLVSGPAHAATFVLQPDGTFQYEGVVDFFGTDSFTYEAVDNEGAHSAPATVTITVADAPESPILTDSSWTTDKDTPLLVPAPGLADAAWAQLPSTDTFFAVADASALDGTVSVLPNGAFSFVPDRGFVGATSFQVQADNGGAIGTATVTIDVVETNRPPEPQADSYRVDEDTPLSITMNGVLSNDVDPDGDELQAVFDAPSAGTLLQSGLSGTFAWAPPADFSGAAVLTYSVTDGIETVGPVAISITVDPVNDVPVALPDSYDVEGPGPHDIAADEGLLANDGDVDGDPLTAVLLRAPAEATVVVDPDGAFTFTPRIGAEGVHTFDYLVSDGLATAKATVEVTVTGNALPNDTGDTGTPAPTDTGPVCDDLFFPDRDGDGYADASSEGRTACEAPAGFTDQVGDCDDTRADRYPGAPETQGDGIDQDCDGVDADITPVGACQTAPGSASFALLLLFPLARRRRDPKEVR